MNILITGSSGMLGGALSQQLSGQHEITGLDTVRAQGTGWRIPNFIHCDITDSKQTIAAISSLKPDLVIHTAAFTDVDGCEANREKAHQVNALGTKAIALACQQCGVFLCYISTDFVFDGKKKTAYIESDLPKPINIYGQSKLAGERFVQSILKKKFIIVRSSGLFGKGGRNFVDSFLKKAQNKTKIEVVNDQFNSPTYTKDLAAAIGGLIDLIENLRGIYHITNSGSCSRCEIAQAVREIGSLDIEIVPVSSSQYHNLTQRPKMSILSNKRYQRCIGRRMRHWREALREYLLERTV